MGKVQHKSRPSMPHWWWIGNELCGRCKSPHNCNQCKAARDDAKAWRRHRLRKERKEIPYE